MTWLEEKCNLTNKQLVMYMVLMVILGIVLLLVAQWLEPLGWTNVCMQLK